MIFLLVLHVIITLTLIGAILVQQSDGGGSVLGAAGSGSGGALFTARGAANLLTHITAGLAFLFIGNCLLMTILSSPSMKAQQNFLNDTPKPVQKSIPKPDPTPEMLDTTSNQDVKAPVTTPTLNQDETKGVEKTAIKTNKAEAEKEHSKSKVSESKIDSKHTQLEKKKSKHSKKENNKKLKEKS